MAMKEYILPRSLELKPLIQMHFNFIFRILLLVGVLPYSQGILILTDRAEILTTEKRFFSQYLGILKPENNQATNYVF